MILYIYDIYNSLRIEIALKKVFGRDFGIFNLKLFQFILRILKVMFNV